MKRFVAVLIAFGTCFLGWDIEEVNASCIAVRQHAVRNEPTIIRVGDIEYVQSGYALHVRDITNNENKFESWDVQKQEGVITYNSKNSPLTIGHIASVHIANNGDVWVVGSNYKLARFDGKNWTMTTTCKTGADNKVDSLPKFIPSTFVSSSVHENVLYVVRKSCIDIVNLASGEHNCYPLNERFHPSRTMFDIEDGKIFVSRYRQHYTFSLATKSFEIHDCKPDSAHQFVCDIEDCNVHKHEHLDNEQRGHVIEHINKNSNYVKNWEPYYEEVSDIEVDKNGTVYIVANDELHIIPAVVSGVEEDRRPDIFNEASVFPNPAVNTVTIDLGLEPPIGAEIRIVDLAGRVVRNIRAANRNETINVQGMSGAYMVVITTPFAREVRTLVVM